MTDQQVPPPPTAPPQRPRARKSLLQELLETVLLTLILFAAARFSLQNFMVQGTSMVPTLQDGEMILVDKISYRFHLPARGDIVVFIAPPEPSKDFIKRVIGLPGDKIIIKPVVGADHIAVNHVFVNGRMLNEPYIAAAPADVYPATCLDQSRSCAPAVVPNGDLFVMGDNRNGSYDSREWGFLPIKNVIGRALIAYWPLPRLGILSNQFSYASTKK